MMSQIGYIYNSFGKQINVCIANTYSNNVLSGSNLPSNSIIIASNIDEDLEDTGTYSLIATDINGNPVRLTYTISEGNGLYYSDEDDALSLNIDNKTIINTESGLTFDISYILSNEFNISGNNINVNMNSLPSTSKTKYGIAKVDGKTLKIDNGKLYVDTANLNYSNNITKQYGIGLGDNKTILTSNGKISLKLDSLNKATNTSFGIVSGDNNTINIKNGILYVNTEKLTKAYDENYGIAKPDNDKIIFNNEGKITINENNLPTSSTTTYGVSKINLSTLSVNDGKISMNNYNEYVSFINEYNEKLIKYKNQIDDISNYLSNGNILYKDNDIRLFSVNESSMSELVHPSFNEEVIDMPEQTITAVFDVVTTCDFNLIIDIKNETNIFPTVNILEVTYNDTEIFNKTDALKNIYKSTNGSKVKLAIKFGVKNFRNTKLDKYIITSFNITIANVEDNLKSKSQKYSIIRYNSTFNFVKEAEHKKEENKNNKRQYVIDKNELYWQF